MRGSAPCRPGVILMQDKYINVAMFDYEKYELSTFLPSMLSLTRDNPAGESRVKRSFDYRDCVTDKGFDQHLLTLHNSG